MASTLEELWISYNLIEKLKGISGLTKLRVSETRYTLQSACTRICILNFLTYLQNLMTSFIMLRCYTYPTTSLRTGQSFRNWWVKINNNNNKTLKVPRSSYWLAGWSSWSARTRVCWWVITVPVKFNAISTQLCRLQKWCFQGTRSRKASPMKTRGASRRPLDSNTWKYLTVNSTTC